MTTALLVFMDNPLKYWGTPVSTARHFRPTHWHHHKQGKDTIPKHLNAGNVIEFGIRAPLLSSDEDVIDRRRWARAGKFAGNYS